MYVECDKRQATRVNAFMKRKYPPSNNKSRTYPLGMNFYYCPLVDACGNQEKNLTAIKKNAAAQNIVVQTTDRIVAEFIYLKQLEWNVLLEEKTVTLREFLSNIKVKNSKRFNGHQLFISINSFRSMRESGVVFNFDVLHQNEANQIIQGLPKLLEFNFGVNPKPYFTKDYLELIKDWKWISAERKMVDPNSAHMQGTQEVMESLGYKCNNPLEEKDIAGEFLNKEHKKSYQKAQGLDNKSVNILEENAIQRSQ